MRICIFCLLILVLFTSCRESKPHADRRITSNPFLDYVQAADSNFKVEQKSIQITDDFEMHVLRMQSQEWLSPDKVGDPLWWHWITLLIPSQVKSDTAFLWIGGGDRNDDPPKEANAVIKAIAEKTSSISIHLHNVPNQPLEFARDTFGPRYEDELISYGWRNYLEGGAKDEDAEWLARFPMTKSVVRAMDAITAYVVENQDRKLTGFTVAGASKRGWTTWTTAVTDKRVAAIAPVVIDMLNVVPSFAHHWQTYGFWAPAVGDYVREGIMDWQHTAEYRRLTDLVEPFSYRDRLTMPKLLINASGDQFFLPDSWQFYWTELRGEKHLRYVPNADHSLRGSDAVSTLVAFHQAILDGQPRPQPSWYYSDSTLYLDFQAASLPDTLRLWRADNPNARDFRLETLGPAWRDSVISAQVQMEVTFEPPEQGWNAHFVEMIYHLEDDLPFKTTTGIRILPDSLPFPAYQADLN